MPITPVFIRYTYYTLSNPDMVITTSTNAEIQGKSETSILKYFQKKYPDRKIINIKEII
jgi:hypothetical protein